jgi:hypothetical protein
MRRAGELPYDWLADNTRWQRKPRTFNGVEEALKATAAFYRKNLLPTHTSRSGLMVARGYASLSFLYTAADAINELAVPAYIVH